MSTGFFERHPNDFHSGPTPEHWPVGVRAISIDGLDLLGMDDQGRLHYDGERIATAGELKLSKWQARIAIATAIVAALGTAATGVVNVLRFFGYGVPIG